MSDAFCLSLVRFADTLTVCSIDNEERNRSWHNLIRERRRFERRIFDLDQKLTTFLQPDHRAKVLANQTKSVEQRKERGTSYLREAKVNDLRHVWPKFPQHHGTLGFVMTHVYCNVSHILWINWPISIRVFVSVTIYRCIQRKYAFRH